MTRTTVSVARSVTLKASPAEVWGLIGDFHGADTWHPMIAASQREAAGDEEFRVLTVVNGAKVMEHLVDKTGHSYTYSIVRSPLPVAHYEAKIEVSTAGAGTRVDWSGSFTPTADNAEEVIAGIYEAGLNALAEKFGTV